MSMTCDVCGLRPIRLQVCGASLGGKRMCRTKVCSPMERDCYDVHCESVHDGKAVPQHTGEVEA